MTSSARFTRAERIRRRVEFQEIYAKGSKIHGRLATVFLLPREGSPGRLGVAATKKFGGAVQRNRAKRLIRDVFRRNKLAPGFDVVVVPKREMLATSQIAFEAEYRQIIERRLRSRPRSGRS